MDLKTYLQSPGSAAQLARALDVHPAMVAQWKSGRLTVPVQRCIDIEIATAGAVTCEDLRSDVDWAYLSSRQIAA